MSETKYTPGPWECVAAEFKGDGVVAYEVRMPQAIASKSNADLISAAPEMAEALLLCLKTDFLDGNQTVAVVGEIRAALTKAGLL